MGPCASTANFGVDAAALRGLADLMDRRRQDLADGRDYLVYSTRIDAGREGILAWLCGQHAEIVSGVDRFLATAADGYAAPYARSISRAAAYYRRTDARVAARFDATRSPVDDPGKHEAPTRDAPGAAPGSTRADPFADRICPADRYLPAVDHQPEGRYTFTPLGVLSPTSAARDLIWRLTGTAVDMGLLDRPYDVIEEVVDQFAGDWTAFANCADAYRHLADALEDAGGCVLDGVRAIPGVWTGNSAEQCALGLARFASDLTGGAAVLRATANAYATAAEQVRAHAATLSALLSSLIDGVGEAALAAAGANPLAGLLATAALAEVAGLVVRARRVVSDAWAVATRFAQTGRMDAPRLGTVRVGNAMPRLTDDLPDLPQAPPASDALPRAPDPHAPSRAPDR